MSVSSKHLLRSLFLLFLFCEAWGQEKKENPYLIIKKQLSPFDQPLSSPGPGDWLTIHPEAGQSFHKFINSRPPGIDTKRRIIYLKPIGAFNTEQQKILSATKGYIEKFFGMEVKIMDTIPLKIFPKQARRNKNGQIQLWTHYINYNLLYPNLPKDACAYMAITTSDLYPDKNWNFVFGEADQVNRIGVSSMARYPITDSNSFQQCLKRMMKTTSHEIAHMLGMEHCIEAACVMNGSNSLEESDRQPVFLCSDCTAKLDWVLQCEEKKRLENLNIFFTYFGFINESLVCFKRQAYLN
jgi:archaemetzincin